MGTDKSSRTDFRSLSYTLLSFLVALSVFVYLFSHVSLEEILATINTISSQSLVLFVLLSFVMSFCRTWRYMLLLQSVPAHLSFVSLFFVTLVRNFFSDLLPARIGTLVYIYLVNKRLQVPLAIATSSFTICFFFDIIAVSILTGLVFLCYTTDFQAPLGAIGMVALFLLFSCMALINLPRILVVLRKYIEKQSLFLNKRELMVDWLDNLVKEIETTKKRKIAIKVFALSLLVRIFKYLALYVLFLGLVMGLNLNISDFPLVKVVSTMIAAEFSASLPVSGIAGFGAYEGTWVFIFQALGYSKKLAIMTSVSHHLITQVYGYGLGGVAALLLILPLSSKTKRQEKGAKQQYKTVNYFWIKLILFLGTGVPLLFCFFPGANLFKTVSLLKSPSDAIIYADTNQKGNLSKLKGQIVYQRPDGIYIKSIESSKTMRVVEGGRYPRFSNDGERIVFLKEKSVMVAAIANKRVRHIATGKSPKAVCFHPDGEHVLFIDGKTIMIASLKYKSVEKFLEGYNFMEVDISKDGKKVVVTVKRFLGYSVLLFDLKNQLVKTVARGCSANLSPDGRLITVNDQDHRYLQLFHSDSLKIIGRIPAPPQNLFDNQKWSNDDDWLVSTSEKNGHNIFIHKRSDGTSYQMTTNGDCDRGDLFIRR